MAKNKLGVFAGVFDPVTNGHCEVLKKSLNDFEKVHIVIMENPNKKINFSLKQRLKYLQVLASENVKIFYWEGLATEYCLKNKTIHIIRGFRNETDLAYETDLKKKYLTQNQNIQVWLYNTKSSISSSLIKRYILEKKDISKLVPW